MIKPECERFEEIAAGVAAGAVGVSNGVASEEEKALFAHIASCESCRRVYSELKEVSDALAKAIPPLNPPPAVRTNLLGAIAREQEITPLSLAKLGVSEAPSPMRVAWPWSLGWGFAVILGILFAWNLYSQREAALRFNTEIEFARLLLSEKEEALKQNESHLRSLRISLSEKEEALKLIEARQTLSVSLTGSLPHAFGKLFWNPAANTGFFIAFDLPLPPHGKVYQLWAIQGGAPVDAGIFSFTQESGTLKVKPIPNPEQAVSLFAVTLEPSGGSAQPTGEILLKGAVSSQS